MAKRPITPRQAAARRENGKKSRGPTSPEGKAKSRLNALKTGVYAIVDTRIVSGPLAEDEEEYNEYRQLLRDELYHKEIERLGLDDSPMLLEATDELITKLRTKKRWRSWSALSYEDVAPSSPLPPASAYTEMLIAHDEAAVWTLRHMTYASAGKLTHALEVIGNHPIVDGDRSWARLRYPAHSSKIMATLLLLLENHGVGLEEAAQVLEERVSSRATQLEFERKVEGVVGVRELLGSDSLRRLIAAESHTSRELERAYRQYLSVLQRLEEAQASENEPTG